MLYYNRLLCRVKKRREHCLLEAAGLAPYQLLAYPAIIMVGAADAAAVVANASAGALFVLIAFICGTWGSLARASS